MDSCCTEHKLPCSSFCCDCLTPLCSSCLSMHSHVAAIIPIPELSLIMLPAVFQLACQTLFASQSEFYSGENPSISPADLSTDTGVVRAAQSYGKSHSLSVLVRTRRTASRFASVPPILATYVTPKGIFRFDPDTAKLRNRPLSPPNASKCGICVIGSTLYACGGVIYTDRDIPDKQTYCLDLDGVEDKGPVRLADMLVEKLGNCVVALLDSHILSVAGFNGNPMAVCEIYDIKQDRWRLSYPLNEKRTQPTLVSFNSHIVYCIGGAYAKKPVEIMDVLEDAPWQIISVSGLRTMEVLEGPLTGGQVSNREILHLDRSSTFLVSAYSTNAQGVHTNSGRNSTSQSACGWGKRRGTIYFVANGTPGRWCQYDVRRRLFEVKSS